MAEQVIDKGHSYELLVIDGRGSQHLVFVKREGIGYPGNVGSHAGTTLQSVLRALVERVTYLQGQFWCFENIVILRCLYTSIWLLEFRAARRHGRSYWHGLRFAATSKLCTVCGHTVCNHLKYTGIQRVNA